MYAAGGDVLEMAGDDGAVTRGGDGEVKDENAVKPESRGERSSEEIVDTGDAELRLIVGSDGPEASAGEMEEDNEPEETVEDDILRCLSRHSLSASMNTVGSGTVGGSGTGHGTGAIAIPMGCTEKSRGMLLW